MNHIFLWQKQTLSKTKPTWTIFFQLFKLSTNKSYFNHLNSTKATEHCIWIAINLKEQNSWNYDWTLFTTQNSTILFTFQKYPNSHKLESFC